MNFAEGADKKKRWSDVFAMAKALGNLVPGARGGCGGCGG